MVELARRVEALEGPDRRIDAEICLATGNNGGNPVIAPGCDGWLVGSADNPNPVQAPSFTASLDAAMKLVPDKAWWWVEAQPLVHGKFLAGCGDERVSGGATPALALTAAALRAMIAKAVEEGGDG